ncbi:hypothetical protein F4V43_02295 [Paenibacillus spiritus]|uniref:Uncharacterized protein n=1 Tax=Paenibacillus spiritus TaxID=2496557 RepID=A0A5J5GGJ9_9BACL|nr:hypothetical protein [Paenibacillus spiritus]KAA9007336.1 hypothetical protein F4V43_02295 [Paenibacillus spiritus]
MGKDQKLGFGAIALVYPFICAVLYFLKATTPNKTKFIDDEIDMSLQKGLANWTYNHFVSFPLVMICVLIAAGLFYWAYQDYQ